MKFDLFCGNSHVVLKDMPDNHFDSVVTDPPYALELIKKRFGKQGSAPAKHGTDGAFSRASKGFMGQQWDTGETAFDFEFWAEVLRVLKPSGYVLAFGGTRTYHRLACAIEDAGFEVRDQIGWLYGTGFPKSHQVAEGWGSALKPAWEPICVGRKAIDGTLEQNWAKWGVGGLNINGCRVVDELLPAQTAGQARLGTFERADMVTPERVGRFPANIIHDGSDEVVAAFPETAPSKAGKPRTGKSGQGWGMTSTGAEYTDSGSAARFFWSAKASRKDRNDGCEAFEEKPLLWSDGTQNPGSFQADGTKKVAANNHPTVKPTELMRYLCKLVTPPGGLVLDPFMGSGRTGRGALLEGFRFAGIEMSEDYLKIARARIEACANIESVQK